MTSFAPNDDMSITPRPEQTTFAHSSSYSTDDQSNIKTPTKDSFPQFGAPMIPQDVPTVPSSYDTSARSKPRKGSLGRSASLRSVQSGTSANPPSNEDAQDESDGDDTDGEGRPSKKKKGQRFYCTDYPPCNLSFTRSEHLARHIRKHTGERPFQCHCLRRFSRLDNLRQHAQTVHLNEDIPADSLAATGTRFQRQVRTDRVRAPGGGRARASTLGSQGSTQAKGHSRNVSTSSIGSVSEFRGMGALGHHQRNQSQGQMGPPPTTPSRGGLGLDTYGASGSDQPYYGGPYYNTGYGSPNSLYSADHNGPLAHSGLQSPIAMVPRGVTWIDPVHTRRMSVPSGSVTFQSPSSYGSNIPYMSPLATSSNASTFSNNSIITSPTSSTFSDHHDFSSDLDHKRRTWHSGSFSSYEQRPATSGLSYYQTPDAPKPMASTQSAAVQNELRLPGIASFDRSSGKSVQHAGSGDSSSYMDLDGAYDQMPRTGSIPQRRAFHQYTKSAPQSLETAAREMQASPGNSPSTPRKQKRQAWYGGPMTQASQMQHSQAMSTSPANSDGSEAPRTPTAVSGPDYQPAIIHSNGLVEPLTPSISEDTHKVNHIVNAPRSLQRPIQPHSQRQQQDYSPTRNHSDMDRLDALVAVATNESQATAT